MSSLRNFHECSLFTCVCVCMCLCVSCYSSKGFTFGVRFLVDEGSRPGGRYFMQKNVDDNYDDDGY